MKLIVGLGNPGQEYAKTRHNVGFMAVDQLLVNQTETGMKTCWQAKFHAQIYEANRDTEKIMLMKPLTYMNRSGLAVAEAISFFKLDPAKDLMVILDDTALTLGDIRIRAKGSGGSHNGLKDIEQKLGTKVYPRLRIGIDEPGILSRTNFVLGKFTPDEMEIMEVVVNKVSQAVNCWLDMGITDAMNKYNKRKSDDTNSNNIADESDN